MPAIARWRRWRPAAEIAANQDFYLTRLPLTGTVQAQFAAWVEAAIVGDRAAKLIEIHRGEGEEQEFLGRGYEFERPQTAMVGEVEHTWTERVQVIRSGVGGGEPGGGPGPPAEANRGGGARLDAARGSGPDPVHHRLGVGAGRQRAAGRAGREGAVDGDLGAGRDQPGALRGPGRGGPKRRKTTQWSVRYQITSVARDDAAIERLVARMGWQVQVTNAASSRLSLGDSVLGYRAGTCVERAFHQLKDQPLGIRPLFVHRDDQVRGLTHLLTLALRVLTLFEVLVRRGQDQDGEGLAGLYPGQPKRTTDRPTAKRVLEAIAGSGLTLTRVGSGGECRWHLTTLPVLVKRVLGYLGLSNEVYTRLVINSG